MGVGWMAEVVTWKIGPRQYFYVTDAVNALTGLFVFIIFICRKKTFRELRRKLRCCCPPSDDAISPSSSKYDTSTVLHHEYFFFYTKINRQISFKMSRQRDSGRNGSLPGLLLLGEPQKLFFTYSFVFSNPILKEDLLVYFTYIIHMKL
jgi:hypothetical protein